MQDFDHEGYALLLQDPVMGSFVRRLPKPPHRKHAPLFASLARAIIHQQLSGKAARTIEERFCVLFGKRTYPSPAAVLRAPDVALRGAGLSAQKVSYLRDLALHCTNRTFTAAAFRKCTDDEVAQRVLQVKGIGRWTADMFLLFTLRRPNILPVGDLGIQKGFKRAFNLRTLPSEQTMRRLAKPFVGHYSLFARYLWLIADEVNPNR